MIRTYLINRNELSEIPYTQDMLSSDRKEKIDKLKGMRTKPAPPVRNFC